MKNKISSSSKTWLFIAACWVAYSFSYIGRLNFSASMADMTANGVILKSQASLVTTGFFICYGLGQVLSGWLGDKVMPRYLVFAGLSGAAICNFIMFFAPPVYVMVILWSLNGLSQSLLWAPIMKAVSDRIPKNKIQKCCTIMATTLAAGTLLAYVISALLINKFGWTSAFISGAVGPMLAAVIWIIITTIIEKDADKNGIQEEIAPVEIDDGEAVPHDEVPDNIFKLFLVSGLLILCIPAGVQGILKDCMSTWVPTFITEMFHTGSVTSILTGTLLPIFGLLGPYITNKIYMKTMDELSTLFILFAISASSLALLLIFGKYSLIISIIALAIAYSMALGQNMIIVGNIPMYFTNIGKVSLVTGLIEAAAYAGTSTLSFTTGTLVEHFGWTFIMIVWFSIAVLACIATLFAKRKWNKFRRNLF